MMGKDLSGFKVYWEEQPKLAVWCLLYRVYAVILRLGGLQQYLWEGNRSAFLYVDLPGSYFISQGVGFNCWCHLCGAVVLMRTIGGVWENLNLTYLRGPSVDGIFCWDVGVQWGNIQGTWMESLLQAKPSYLPLSTLFTFPLLVIFRSSVTTLRVRFDFLTNFSLSLNKSNKYNYSSTKSPDFIGSFLPFWEILRSKLHNSHLV